MFAIYGGGARKRPQHTVNEQIEEASEPGDQAAFSSNLQRRREPQPALAKRIPNLQGAIENLTILHVL